MKPSRDTIAVTQLLRLQDDLQRGRAAIAAYTAWRTANPRGTVPKAIRQALADGATMAALPGFPGRR